LMWMDIDFEKKIAHVRRSIVETVPGKVKTEVSEKHAARRLHTCGSARLVHSDAL